MAYVLSLSRAGSVNVGSYIGDGEGFGVAVDARGNAYVTGRKRRDSSFDVFVRRVDPTAARLFYDLTVGGTGSDMAADLGLDGQANAHVVGNTTSADFPTLDGLRASFGGDADGFVLKVSPVPILLSAAVESISWTSVDGATGYDVVRGDVRVLNETAGDFTAATQACLANNQAITDIPDPELPAPSEGFWYLARAVTLEGNGTYDSGLLTQVGERDAEINASLSGCP